MSYLEDCNVKNRLAELEEAERRHGAMFEDIYNELRKVKSLNIDYDLFVINPDNKNTTQEELRDCVFDALNVIDDRLKCIEVALNIRVIK